MFRKSMALRILAIHAALAIAVTIPWKGSQGHAAMRPPPSVTAEFVPGELIVKFKPGVSRDEIDAMSLREKIAVLSENNPGRFMHMKVLQPGRSVVDLIQIFRQTGKVEYAEPNYILRACAMPNDPQFDQLWGLHNTGQSGGTNDADIDAPEAWDMQTGNDVVIAVIDTGVDYSHEDLSDNIWTNPDEIADNGLDDDGNGLVDDVRGWDFVNNDNDPGDDNSHGTHVAGIIAARGNNGIGVTGVAWTAKIMPLKFLNAEGNGATTDAIKAIQYATLKGARIMNSSWGGGGFSQALKDAIADADAAGALFVAAAGNNGTDNDLMPFYPASYELSNIIAVAATDHDDDLAWFSNYGFSSVDLAAPGKSILSTTPAHTYGYKNGTSMATPFVAGVAALILAELPDMTPLETKTRVLNAVDPIFSLQNKVSTRGRLNAEAALLGVEPIPEIVVFQDDMEIGPAGWTVSGETSLWHRSRHRHASPTTSWYYGIESAYNYHTGGRNLGALTSPSIDLADFRDSTLRFSHYLDTENLQGFDRAVVRVSSDNGVTFQDVFTKRTTSGVFVQEVLDLSAYDGTGIRIQFFFDTVDALFNTFEGWYVDDVVVAGRPVGPPPNTPPVADAGPDRTLSDADGDGTESTTLDGSDSHDIDGEIIGYEWREGETVLGTAAAIAAAFTVGEHSLTLTVTDDDGATGTDEVVVVVNPNQPPTADAGPDQTVTDTDDDGYEPVALTGSGSDPDGTLTYEWKEGATVLGEAASITVDFAVGAHLVTFTVTDNGGASDSDEVLVTVNPAPPPQSTMHVAGIDMSLNKKGARYNGTALVKVVDDGGEPVAGAVVSGNWDLDGKPLNQASGMTDTNGIAALSSDKIRAQSGTIFTIAITGVARQGWTYEPEKNVETTDKIRVP